MLVFLQNQPTKPKVPTLKLWFRKKKKRKLNQIFPLFRRWSQPSQPNNSNGRCPEMSWWHQSWSQHFSTASPAREGGALPPSLQQDRAGIQPWLSQGAGSTAQAEHLPAQGRLELPESLICRSPTTLNTSGVKQEKSGEGLSFCKHSRAWQPGTACRSRCLAGSRLWLLSIIRKTLLCFPAHLAKAGDKRWQCPTGWGKGCANLGLFQGWSAFQIWRGAFPCRCRVPKAYLETKSLPSPLGFQNSQTPFKEKCKTHLINMERNTLTKLSRSTRVRESIGETEADFQHFFHNNDQNLHNTKNLTCKCKHHYNPCEQSTQRN